MSHLPSFRIALHEATCGAKAWFLVSGCAGLSLVVLGRVLGVHAHKAYGSALLLPFLLAACMGSFAVAASRHRKGVRAFGTDGRGHLVAAFIWSVICLSGAVAADWAFATAGLLVREPNEFLDSVGMVLVVSTGLSLVVALPLQRRSDA